APSSNNVTTCPPGLIVTLTFPFGIAQLMCSTDSVIGTPSEAVFPTGCQGASTVDPEHAIAPWAFSRLPVTVRPANPGTGSPTALQGLIIVQAGNRSSRCPNSQLVQELARHEPYAPVDARPSDAIASRGADDSGHVSPVAVIVPGVGILIEGVDAVAVIDVAI